jgi:predicted SAM-dependent methyltransferase
MSSNIDLVDIKTIFTPGLEDPDVKKIPKRFFSTWKTSLINSEQASYLKQFRELHPEFTFEFYDDDAMDQYMIDYWRDHPIFEVYKNSVYGASKADIWRYCILYHKGGIYLDFDSAILFDMNSIPENNSELISFESNKLDLFVTDESLPNFEFFKIRNFKKDELSHAEYPVLQWCLIFSKGHRILEIAINNIVEQSSFYINKVFTSAHNAIINFTAPIQLTNAVWKYVEEGNQVNQLGIDFNGLAAFKHLDNNTSYTQDSSNSYHKKENVQILKDSVRLNVGCGNNILKGYKNIDMYQYSPEVILMDIRKLSLPENSVDEIYAKDVIEHMGLPDAIKTLHHWGKLIKTGGKLIIQTTSFELMAEAYRVGKLSMSDLNYLMFAGVNWAEGRSDWCSEKVTEHDWHKSIYTKELISQILTKNNFEVQYVFFDDIETLSGEAFLGNISHGLNIRIRAVKL